MGSQMNEIPIEPKMPLNQDVYKGLLVWFYWIYNSSREGIRQDLWAFGLTKHEGFFDCLQLRPEIPVTSTKITPSK